MWSWDCPQGRMFRLEQDPSNLVLKDSEDPHKFRLYDATRHVLPYSTETGDA